jgi:hypothetical protein
MLVNVFSIQYYDPLLLYAKPAKKITGASIFDQSGDGGRFPAIWANTYDLLPVRNCSAVIEFNQCA